MKITYELTPDVVTALNESYPRDADDGLTDEEFAEHKVKDYISEIYEAWAVNQIVKVSEETAREQAKVDSVDAVKVLDDKGDVKPEQVKSVDAILEEVKG